jgi:hypothetical protein
VPFAPLLYYVQVPGTFTGDFTAKVLSLSSVWVQVAFSEVPGTLAVLPNETILKEIPDGLHT